MYPCAFTCNIELFANQTLDLVLNRQNAALGGAAFDELF
jgi:hypothetical protein